MTRSIQKAFVLALIVVHPDWGLTQPPEVPPIEDLKQIIAEELRSFGVAVDNQDLVYVKRWLGKDFLEEVESLQTSNTSSYQAYLIWQRVNARIRSSQPPGVVRVIKNGIDLMNTGFTIHGISTIALIENASKTLKDFVGHAGDVFVVAGYIVAIDNFCDVWAENGDVWIAGWQLGIASVGAALTAVGFLFPTVAPATTVSAAVITIIGDWTIVKIVRTLEAGWRVKFIQVSDEFRKFADQKDWISIFQNSGFTGVLLTLREAWQSESWRDRLDPDLQDWMIEYKERLDIMGPETYFKNDIAPVLQGWTKSQVRHAEQVSAERVQAYLMDLMSQTVRIHIRPLFVDFEGKPMHIRPKMTVHDQPIPFQYNGFNLMTRVDTTEPHIDLVLKSGHQEIDITQVQVDVAGGDIQIVVPMKYFLRLMSESDNHMDVDAALIRPKFPVPEMELPVWPFPLRLDDIKAWWKHGLEINREGKQTHIGVVGGTRIVIPTVPVTVTLKDTQGSIAKGQIKVSSGSVSAEVQGTAVVQVPSVGKTWIGFAGNDGRNTGDGVLVDGRQFNPMDPAKNSVTLTVATGSSSGRPHLPNLPPLPTVEVGSEVQDANTAITLLESRQITYDEAWRTFSDAHQLAMNHIASARNQWDSYKAALAKRLNASDVPYDQVQRTLDERQEAFFAQVETNQQTLDAVTARMNKAIDRIRKENQDRLAQMQTVSDQGQKPYLALRETGEDLRVALPVANRLRQPRRFERLADVEVDRRALESHVDKVENMRGELQAQLESLKAQTHHLAMELEHYAEFLLTSGSLFRFERAMDTFQSHTSTLVSFEAMIAATETLLDARACDNALGALRKTDSILSWLQLVSAQQIALAEAVDQSLASAPSCLKSEPPELGQVRDMRDLANEVQHTMVVIANRGHARRPQDTPHNGFGVDAYEGYQPLPEMWADLKRRLVSMVNTSKAWEEDYLKKLDALRAEVKTLDPSGWYVREVADAIQKRAAECVELGRRKRLKNALEQSAVVMDGLALAARDSRIANMDFDALLRVNLDAFVILEEALAHAEAGDLMEAERAHRRAIHGFVELGLIDVPSPSGSGTSWGYVRRAPVEELWMLLRVERLLGQVDRLIAQLKSQQFEADLADLSVELRGVHPEKVILQLVGSDEGSNFVPTFSSNVSGDRHTSRVPPGRYTIHATGAGLRITPDNITVDLPKRGSKTVVMKVESAVGTGDSGATSILTALSQFHPSSRILIEDFQVPEERPSFSADNRYVVTSLNLELTRIQISDSAREEIVQSEDPIPYARNHDRPLGGIQPKVVGDSVVYTAATSFYVLGSGSLVPYMAVPLPGGKANYLFDQTPNLLIMADARVQGEPEFLIVGEINDRPGWFILRGAPPKPEDAEFLVHHAQGYAQSAAVSRDWQVFAMTTEEHYGQWTIFDRSGRVLARTPPGDRWQTLTLGPKGKFFVAQHPDPRDGSVELFIAEVSQPDVILPIYSGAVTMGSMGWSADGRLLAGRVFIEGQQVQLRLFDLFGGSGPKPQAYRFDPNKKAENKDTPPPDEESSMPRNTQDAYEKYIEAYNALTELMAQGQGDTPEAQEAYQKYKEAKDAYEAAEKDNPTQIESH